MKNYLFCFFLALSFLNISVFAQYYNEDNNERIISLKERIKELKSLRDKIIVKRWSDRKKYYQDFETFKEDYHEQKNVLNSLQLRLQNLKEHSNNLLQSFEKNKSTYQVTLNSFENLSLEQKSILQNYANNINQRLPIQLQKRIEHIERIIDTIDLIIQEPQRTVQKIESFLKNEYALTQKVFAFFNHTFTTKSNKKQKGLLLDAGSIGSYFLHSAQEETQIKTLLRNNNFEGQLYQWKQNINSNVQDKLIANLESLNLNSKNQTILVPIDVLQSSIASTIYTEINNQNFIQKIWNYFYQGGIWMIPLFLTALVAFIFILNRLFYWRKYYRISKQKSHQLLDTILELTQQQKLTQAIELCHKYPKFNLLKPILFILETKQKNTQIAFDDLERQVQTHIIKETSTLEKFLTTIIVLGSVAPLIGLLGTVAGMIALFQVITLYGSGDPKLMASGISLALTTTQTGLAIAVPIMILHNYLNNLTNKAKHLFQYYNSELLNTLYHD